MGVLKLQTGDIILVRGTSLLSRSIQEVEGSVYSHAAGIVKENEIIEAQGFQTTGYEAIDKYKGEGDVFTCDILTDEQRKRVVEFVEKEVGSYYDWILLILEFIRYVFHLMLPYKKIFNSHICSTLWADAYRSVGIDLCPGIKYPSPKDLSESGLLRKINSL